MSNTLPNTVRTDIQDCQGTEEGYLRTRLREADAGLYAQLLDCWRRGEEWLPGLGKNKGSFNSYPHLQNVERKLDMVVSGLERRKGGGYAFRLSPIELFLLLASVLFHDVGRLSDAGAKNGREDGDDAGTQREEPDELSPPDCRLAVDLSLEALQACAQALDDDSLMAHLGTHNWGESDDSDSGEAKWSRRCLTCLRQGLSGEGCWGTLGGPSSDSDRAKAFRSCPMESFEYSAREDLAEGDFCGSSAKCPLFCLACRIEGWHKGLLRLSKEGHRKDHSVHSYEMLRNPGIYPSLGLREPQLARSLAAICLYHGKKSDTTEYLDCDTLHTTFLDHYGKVREKEIAALLKLADVIDGSFRRAVPAYIREGRPAEIIGRFREKVSGISVAPPAQMVVTELGDWSLDHQTRETVRKVFESCQQAEGKEFTRASRISAGLVDLVEGYRETKPRGGTFWDAFCPPNEGTRNGGDGHTHLRQRILDDLQLAPAPHRLGTRLMWDAAYPDDTETAELPDRSDQQRLIRQLCGDVVALAAVMGDVVGNTGVLRNVSGELAGVGLQLHAWLIGYKEHLYTGAGDESFEPVFDKTYLKRVCDCMLELSEGVLGQSEFSYETLAAGLRDPDVKRVKMAVRRLSIITQDMQPRRYGDMGAVEDKMDAIWYGETLWRWNVEEYTTDGHGMGRKLRSAAAVVCRSATLLVEIKKRIHAAGEGDEYGGSSNLAALLERIRTHRGESEPTKEWLETTRDKSKAWRICSALKRQIDHNHGTVSGICRELCAEMRGSDAGHEGGVEPEAWRIPAIPADHFAEIAARMAETAFRQEYSFLKTIKPWDAFAVWVMRDLVGPEADRGKLARLSRLLHDLAGVLLTGLDEPRLPDGPESLGGPAWSDPGGDDWVGGNAVASSVARLHDWFCFCRGIPYGLPFPEPAPSPDTADAARRRQEEVHGLLLRNQRADRCVTDYLRECLRIAQDMVAVREAMEKLAKREEQFSEIQGLDEQLRHISLSFLQAAELGDPWADGVQTDRTFKLVVGRDVKKRIDTLSSPV